MSESSISRTREREREREREGGRRVKCLYMCQRERKGNAKKARE